MLRASILRCAGVGLLQATIVSLVVLFAMPAHAAAITEEQIIQKTNTERSAEALVHLVYDERLAQSAQAKAEHMVTYNYWGHNAPDGTSPWVFIRQAGVAYDSAGENLARGFSDSSSLVDAWMQSPMHQANILNTTFTHIGIGVYTGVSEGVETTIVVAHYASPQFDTATQEVRPNSFNIEDMFQRSWMHLFQVVRFANRLSLPRFG